MHTTWCDKESENYHYSPTSKTICRSKQDLIPKRHCLFWLMLHMYSKILGCMHSFKGHAKAKGHRYHEFSFVSRAQGKTKKDTGSKQHANKRIKKSWLILHGKANGKDNATRAKISVNLQTGTSIFFWAVTWNSFEMIICISLVTFFSLMAFGFNIFMDPYFIYLNLQYHIWYCDKCLLNHVYHPEHCSFLSLLPNAWNYYPQFFFVGCFKVHFLCYHL